MITLPKEGVRKKVNLFEPGHSSSHVTSGHSSAQLMSGHSSTSLSILALSTQARDDQIANHRSFHSNGAPVKYRLQQNAYVNRGEGGALGHLPEHWYDTAHAHYREINASLQNHGTNTRKVTEQKNGIDTSFTKLPSIVISRSDDNQTLGHKYQPDLFLKEEKLESKGNQQSLLAIPSTHLSMKTKKPKAPIRSGKKEGKQTDVYSSPSEVAMKLSLPCHTGCCYCVYARLLGPVRIFVSRGEPLKKGPFLGKIKDGNGRPVIPVSRKHDLIGLVYDPCSHCLYPPASKFEKPLYYKPKNVQRRKLTVQTSNEDDKNKVLNQNKKLKQ